MKTKINISFAYFFIAAVFGLLMRASFTTDLGLNFKHLLHTHSHIALLGWLYNLSMIFIGYYFFKKREAKYNRIFWVSQITFLGMLFSFPFQGYAFWSITFSTLYLFASYWLIIEIYASSKTSKKLIEHKLLRTGGFFLFLSSIGPFALGAIMAKDLQSSIWYGLSIYWFLHFLFNGFFYTVFLALLLTEVKKKVKISEKKIKWVYYLTVGSIIPLYAEFTIDSITSNWIIFLSIISSIAQVISVLLIGKELLLYINQIYSTTKKWLLSIPLIAWGLKIIFQLLLALPLLHKMVFNSKSTLIIGYLHLVMLGMFSLFFIWLLIETKVIQLNRLFKFGLFVFAAGVLLSEGLLFGQGLANYFWSYSLPTYYTSLYAVSSIMPTGILIMFVALFRSSKTTKN